MIIANWKKVFKILSKKSKQLKKVIINKENKLILTRRNFKKKMN